MKLLIQDTAKMLNLPVGTVERWIRQGRIPIRKNGPYCFFKEAALERWADTHNVTLTKKDTDRQDEPEETISLLSAMERGGVYHDIPGLAVEAVLTSVADRIPLPEGLNRKLLLNRLFERERLASTGIGNGVAIPHPRSPLQDGIRQAAISTCFLENEIDYQAIDGKPVFVLFLLISSSTKIHLHLLSRLSFCVREASFVSFLKTRPESARLLETIAALEKKGHP